MNQPLSKKERMAARETRDNKQSDRPTSVLLVGALLLFTAGLGFLFVTYNLLTNEIQSILIFQLIVQLVTITATIGLIKMKLWGWVTLTAIIALNFVTSLLSFNIFTTLMYTLLLLYLLNIRNHYYD